MTDPDEALRVALKLAVDVGQWDRVRALTELLATPPKVTPKATPLLVLAGAAKLPARRGR